MMSPFCCPWCYALIVLCTIQIQLVEGSLPLAAEDRLLYEKRLFTRAEGYNPYARPVYYPIETLPVTFGLSITQLLDVDEKNQIMTTSVWMKHQWHDYRLSWNESDYDNLSAVSIPEHTVWIPDIVLYNNADGNFGSSMSKKQSFKARIYSDGTMFFAPPTIFKSPCQIDIEFFPFDEQRCTLKFGSWAYSGNELLLMLMHDEAEKEDFWENSEWEVVEAPGINYTMKYDCCAEIYSNIEYVIVIRRRSAFYVVNLIIPCMIMSFLTLMVFYLPPDSGEKVSLCISILLALSVFQLLVADIMPPSSVAMPLIGRYLMFTEFMVMVSIIITVIVLNVHHRSGIMHTDMPAWVNLLFLNILPRMLCMRPRICRVSKEMTTNNKDSVEMEAMLKKEYHNSNLISCEQNGLNAPMCDSENTSSITCANTCLRCSSQMVFPRVNESETKVLEEVRFISDYIRNESSTNEVRDDWKFVAMVVDRIFLWIFTIANVSGACAILLKQSSPS